MMFRPLLLSLCLAAPLWAQDAAKSAPPAEKPATPSTSTPAPPAAEWTWQVPSVQTMARFAKLSAEARAHLQAEAATAVPSPGAKEYNERFEKAFRAAVKDDEAKGLSSGGVPDVLFTERGLSYTRRGDNRAGPTPEQRAKWETLSDAAKEKMKSLFRDHGDSLKAMTEKERHAFIESQFKSITEEDEAARKGK
ncbi:MAG: hypothetical protein JWO94_3465 [Verrucomicrobiaceae bacterium]|nr:hypothetical protein [Verrucomicrobiaceae bacterium]